jgi:Na+/melibiose symporter-like transporter
VPASFSSAAATAWVIVCFLLAATAFSLFQVPYIALPAEVAPGYHARTKLMSWRVAVLAVAILLFGAGGPALRDAAGGGHRGYLVMGVVAGLVIGAGMLATWWGAGGAEAVAVAPAREHGGGVREGLAAARVSAPFRALLTVFVLQALATGAMLAGAQYVATYVLHREAAVSFLFAALVAPAVLVMPLWSRLAHRVGKERAFALATALFAAAALSLLLLAVRPGPWVYLPVAVAGVAYAGLQMFPLAMLPDVVTHHARRDPAVRAGSFSGLWTAGETAGLALGPALVLLLLAATGFQSSRAGEAVTQPDGAVLGIVLAFSVLPAVLVVVSLLVLRGYRLRQVDVDALTVEAAR